MWILCGHSSYLDTYGEACSENEHQKENVMTRFAHMLRFLFLFLKPILDLC